jgi:hypothetical protein
MEEKNFNYLGKRKSKIKMVEYCKCTCKGLIKGKNANFLILVYILVLFKQL